MDVASGNREEKTKSGITTQTTTATIPNVLAIASQKEAITITLGSNGGNLPLNKDDAGSSSPSSSSFKSNTSSSVSEFSRPSTDSTTTTTTSTTDVTENYSLSGGDNSTKFSTELTTIASTTTTTTTTPSSLISPTTTILKSNYISEQQQEDVDTSITNQNESPSVGLSLEKSVENLTQNQQQTIATTIAPISATNQQSLAIGGGIPLARSSPISREYLALKKSLNESKILTEFVTDTSAIKTARKGRKSGLSSSLRDSPSNKSGSGSANRLRSIDPLEISNEEQQQQRAVGKRNMRSHNSEFAQKHMEFLNRVISQQQSGDEQYGSEADEVERIASINNDEDDDQTSANVSNSGIIANDLADIGNLDARLKGIWVPAPKRGWDCFCWRCRECSGSTLILCSKCARCFHKHCIKMSSYTKFDSSWMCPECLAVENALNSPKKATRRPDLSLDMLSELLTFALKRMRTSKGSSKFLFAEGDYSYLSKYIVNPVTFTTLEEKIAKKVFRCPEEFYNETKWMVHNAHIITTGFTNHKLLVTAKSIVKICRQETNEIETCAGCYLSANTRSDWFVDVCAQPHILLWAKLKGFPYWPAKAMGIGQNAVVNVRFFGKHDRAFVPIKDCYLYSRQDPNMQTGKRSQRELADCIKEVEEHIKNIELKVGKFNYAPLRTPYEPNEELQQLETMMPGVSQYVKRQAQAQVLKPSLQYKIVKTAGNHLSIIRKGDDKEGNEESDMTSAANESEIITRKDNKNAIGNVNCSGGGGGSNVGGGIESTKLTISTKYEVITKTTASDSDSATKVTAVILKKRRKTSNQNDFEKEENVSDAKIAKTQNEPIVMIGNKRKQQSLERSPGDASDSGSEKQKSKHARIEPRLPILTIKTGCGAKLVEHASAREVVEHLSKTNTGVTIKKVNKTTANVAIEPAAAVEETSAVEHSSRATRSSVKDAATKQTNDNLKDNRNVETISATSATIAAPTTPITATTKTSNEKKTAAEKAERAEERRNIFRELVPFVEVKQEVCSDAEDVEEADTIEKQPTTITTTKATTQPINKDKEAPISIVCNTDKQTLAKERIIDPLLTVIKAEVMSDEETDANRSNTTTSNVLETAREAPKSSSTENTSIRVVGDTIIQRLSSKQATATTQQLQQVTGLNNSIAQTLTTTTSKGTNLAGTSPNNVGSNSNKRVSTRSGGVPYGPFPAAAATSSSLLLTDATGKPGNNFNPSNETTINEISQQHVGQRARKSFPNRSPPRIMTTMPITAAQRQTTAASPSPSPTSTPALSHNNQNINKQNSNNMLKSTSMVSIPADIAAQRNITQMPPLTAVSKTMPVTASATNTLAGGAPNMAMATRVGGTTQATFASSSSSSNISINGTNSNNTFVPPIKLNAPPPLAGLSTFATVSQLQQQQQTIPISNVAATTAANIAPAPCCPSNNSTLTPDAAMVSASATTTTSTENHLLGDFVTPALANAITEVICRGPPRMAPRPNGPLQSDGSTMFPSDAGPVCRTLVQNAHKLTDFFISVMEDTMCEMSNNDEASLQAKITLLTMELERMKQGHEQEIAELKRTSDLMLCEMRKSMENEKTRIANEIRKQCELERLRCVEEAKRKQWCANCGREAQFYCCWNTSYCDYPCQQQHWSRHAANCAQTRSNNEASAGNGSNVSVNNTSLQPIITAASSMNPLALNSDVRNKNSAATTVNVHYNKNVSNSKKDKTSNASKVAMNVAGGSIATGAAGGLSGDLLKLPSNTSLRPVAIGGNASNTQARTSAAATQQQQQQQQQRYNISLPISSSSTVNPRAPYTIVQRCGNWELTPTTNTMTPINTLNTGVTGPQQATISQQRTASNINMGGRTRGVSIVSYNATTNGGNMRSTQM